MTTKSLTLFIHLPISNWQSTSLTQVALGLLLFLRSFKIHCMLYLCLYLCFSSFFLDPWLSLSLSVLVSFQILNLWSCVYVQILATNGCGHGIWPWDRESWRCLSREWPNWPGFLFHQQQHPWWRQIHHSQSLSFLAVHRHKPPSR